MSENLNPELNKSAFNCPNCGAYSEQIWNYAELYLLKFKGLNRNEHTGTMDGYPISTCIHCQGYAIWKGANMIYPSKEMRHFDLTLVPEHIAEDYTEACLVLPHSPKASAALSRRCLQTTLHEKGYKDGSLFKEIQAVIDSKTLPSHITDSIDAIRIIGNFAAHPQKDKNTGEIMPVEIGEADWNLDVLESLFDSYYIQPEKTKQRKEDLNKKLEAAGKPKMV